eukprot:RCo035307
MCGVCAPRGHRCLLLALLLLAGVAVTLSSVGLFLTSLPWRRAFASSSVGDLPLPLPSPVRTPNQSSLSLPLSMLVLPLPFPSVTTSSATEAGATSAVQSSQQNRSELSSGRSSTES